MTATNEHHALILVVDDDVSLRMLMCAALQEIGYQVAEAENGRQALDLLESLRPDAILLDVMMPGLDGFETCKELRLQPGGEHTPVLMITGLEDVDSIHRAFEAGATDFISKPINWTMLGYRVRYMLRASKMTAELKQLTRKLERSKREVEDKHQDLIEIHEKLKVSQATIFQQDKLAAIGQLAAGVAHEINNPTGFVSSNLRSLGKYLDKMVSYIDVQTQRLKAQDEFSNVDEVQSNTNKIDFILEDARDLIAESLEGMKRISQIVQALKGFSRIDDIEVSAVNLNECLESTIKIIWNELKYKATLHKNFGKLPLTHCHPQQLNQVFLNLLVNASHAIETRGEIGIKTWAENKSIFISIRDTGVGIPEEAIDRIFEAFFTTKEVGKGTGLGLSISYEIIHKHQGEISVESEIGKGTTFTVRLPVVSDKPFRVEPLKQVIS